MIDDAIDSHMPVHIDHVGGDGDAEAHREWGRRTNARCWDLLGSAGRAASEDRELVEAAYASAWHWRQVGTAVNEQRAEWLISRVHAVLGNRGAALRHAERCWVITEAEALDGFDRAYACEAMYRAAAVNGDAAAAADWHERALSAADGIADREDRNMYLADLALPVNA